MVEKIWFEKHPLGYLLWPLLWPLSLLFGYIARRRKACYQNGSKACYRAPVPVIVVGNITAGGNGKTPVVVWLVETLQKQGYKPGVVSRGYGGRSEHYPLLVTDDTSTLQSGDEPKLIYQRTQAPVAVSPVRSDAVQALLERDVDIVITDDGMQHYALARDIEISVVDGQRRFGNEQLIPLGPLREPVVRQKEVDIIINNGGPAHGDECVMTLMPDDAINLLTGERKSVSELTKLVAIAGIGHPQRFFDTLQSLSADVVASQGFADHQSFEQMQLQTIAKSGLNLIMTEKDAVKCMGFAQKNWWYLPVSATFSAQDEMQILQKITQLCQQ